MAEKALATTATLDIHSQFDKRAEALKDVLTPEQFERYQKYQEQQLKLIESFMPRLGSNSTIHVTPVISQSVRDNRDSARFPVQSA